MKRVLRNVYVEVDNTDLSDHFSAITVEDSATGVDSTAFGSVYTSEMKGMRTAQITGTVQQDFDVGSVDAVLSALNDQDTPFEVLVVDNADSPADITATNPGYHMVESQLLGYTPLSGSVGDLSTTEVTFTNAGDAGVARVTTAP